VHRHYTFVLVYGDRDTFRRRARDFVLAPLLVFAVVGAVAACRGVGGDRGRGRAPGGPCSSVGVWNVWHTLMQRYGILRIYAGQGGARLQAGPMVGAT
jgi:hypothetical protein